MPIEETSGFFDSVAEEKEFMDEMGAPKQEYTEPEEEIIEDAEVVQDEEGAPIADEYYWTAFLALSIVDETRAIVASAYSGAPMEKYLQYGSISVKKRGGAEVPNKESAILNAAAYVFSKWQFRKGPEAVLIFSLLATSLTVVMSARADAKEQRQKEQKEQQKKAHQAPPMAQKL